MPQFAYRHSLAFIILLAVLIFQYRNQQQINLDQYQSGLKTIQALKLNDVSLLNEVLKLRAGQASNFDQLTEYLTQSHYLGRNLVAQFEALELDISFQQLIATYQSRIERQSQLIEDFKSDIAVLNNSLRYIGSAAARFVSNRQLSAEIKQSLLLYSIESLTLQQLYHFPQISTFIERTEKLNQIIRTSTKTPSSNQLVELVSHNQILSNYGERMHQSVSEIFKINSTQIINQINIQYGDQLNQIAHQMTSHQRKTYIILAVVCLYCIYLLYRLRQALANLKLNNIQLESKVRNRTVSLIKNNVELKILDEIIHLVNRESDIRHILDIVLVELRVLIPQTNRCFYGHLADKNKKLKIIAYQGEQQLPKSFSLEISRELCDSLFLKDAADIEKGIAKKSFADDFQFPPELAHFNQPKGLLTISLQVHGRTIGYFLLVNNREQTAFDQIDPTNLVRLREHTMTALEKANLLDKLQRQSTTDALTGLNNRRYLTDTIARDTNLSKRAYQQYLKNTSASEPTDADLIFYIIDLDRFKSVNDVYGHEAGDSVLIQASQLLRSVCRDSDHLIRWGGEEFVVVSRQISRQSGGFQAERICQAFAQTQFNLGNHQTMAVTCSIGFASYPFNLSHPDAMSWQQVVAIADSALYGVKNNGRNGWIGISNSHHESPKLTIESWQQDIVNAIELRQLSIESSIRPLEKINWN